MQEDHEFEASLDYITKPCLKKQKTRISILEMMATPLASSYCIDQTQTGVTREEGTAVEDLPPSDWPVGMSVFLNSDFCFLINY